jgi:hypothetical protein
MAEMSDYLENALLNATLNGTSFTGVAQKFLVALTLEHLLLLLLLLVHQVLLLLMPMLLFLQQLLVGVL